MMAQSTAGMILQTNGWDVPDHSPISPWNVPVVRNPRTGNTCTSTGCNWCVSLILGTQLQQCSSWQMVPAYQPSIIMCKEVYRSQETCSLLMPRLVKSSRSTNGAVLPLANHCIVGHFIASRLPERFDTCGTVICVLIKISFKDVAMMRITPYSHNPQTLFN